MIRRPCQFCGATHDFLSMALVDDGANPRFATFGLQLRNDPHGGTVAEVAGHVAAAQHIARAIPERVRIQEGVVW